MTGGPPPTPLGGRRARRAAIVWTLLVVTASLADPGALLRAVDVPPAAGSGGTAGAVAFALAHLIAYGVLAWLLVASAPNEREIRPVLAAIAVATAVGAGVELLQVPVAARTASAVDAAVNAAGAAVGAGARALTER